MDQKLLDNGLAIALLVTIVVVFVRWILPWLKERAKTSDEERRQAQQQNIETLKEIATLAREQATSARKDFLGALTERDQRATVEHRQTTEVLTGLTQAVKELKDKE